jgi:hypothetical protein
MKYSVGFIYLFYDLVGFNVQDFAEDAIGAGLEEVLCASFVVLPVVLSVWSLVFSLVCGVEVGLVDEGADERAVGRLKVCIKASIAKVT